MEGKMVLYSDEGANIYVNVYFDNDTFWMTQRALAELFDCSTDNISLHLKNIYADEELEENATTEKIPAVQLEGERSVTRKAKYYSLDAIIAVGYRVNSKKATKFRQWATKTLKEYIQKGFLLNDDMLKNGRPFGKEYWIIRPIKKTEIILLTDFLYEAIFQKDINNLAPRTIIQDSSLWIYIDGFGTKKDDHCFVAELNGKVVGAVWVRCIKAFGHIDDAVPEFAISTYPQYRGKGIGTKLMRRMLIWVSKVFPKK